MWTKKKEQEISKIQKRVDKIPTGDLASWADQCLVTIDRNLAEWKRSSDPLALEEAVMGSEALHVVISTIQRRNSTV